jgi:NADH-quinone oxidoreductase subunit J
VFGAISGIFMLLQAQFLALSQLMIYAVGITLVVVIALMLTNPKLEQDVAPFLSEHKLPTMFVGTVLFITIYLGLRAETWQTQAKQFVAPEDNVMQLGVWLLSYYSIPFEFASVLLLMALVGAIMLAKSERPPRAERLLEEAQDSAERSDDNVIKV